MSDDKKVKKSKSISGIVITVIIVLVAIIISSTSTVVTNQNEYTLVRQFGRVAHVIKEPGLSFMTPMIQSADKIPKSTMLYDLEPSDVITKDKKNMVVDSFVLWQITDPLLFVQTLNAQMVNAESRIDTIVYNSTKNVISSLTQEEVISGRDGKLVSDIMNSIGETFNQYGIKLVAVETKQIDLPSANKEAVYGRMISERNNIAAQYIAEGESEATKIRTETDTTIKIKLSEAESEAERIIAEGEAEYMKIMSEVYNNPEKADFYQFVLSLDAAKKTMIGDNKTLILDKDSPIAQIFENIK